MRDPALASLSVLVVDDEPEVRDVLAGVLARLGVGRVEVAAGGREAIAAIDAGVTPFDALICDLEMPDGDGPSLMRALMSRRPQPSLILVSGAGDRELEAAGRLGESLGLVIIAKLAKPVTPRALAGALVMAASNPRAAVTARIPDGDDTPAPVQGKDPVDRFMHDAAAPLMTIRMLTELLLEEERLETAQVDDLRKIREAADELTRMLKNFSRGR